METVELVNTIIFGLFSFLGITLNSITIVILMYGEKSGKGIKLRLINLAVADLLSAITVAGCGVLIGVQTSPYPESEILCKAQHYTMLALFSTSLFCHLYIAIDRFVAVYFPLKMLRYQRRHVIMTIIAVWLFSFTINIPGVTLIQVYEYPPSNGSLSCISAVDSFLDKKSHSLQTFYVVKYIFVAVCLMVLYGLLCIKLLRRKRIGEKHKYSNNSNNGRVIVMLASNAVGAIITYIPFTVWLLTVRYSATQQAYKHPPIYLMVFFGLTLANCFISPIVYFIFQPQFKEDGKRIFANAKRKICCTKKVNSFNTKEKQKPNGINLEKKNTAHQIVIVSGHLSADNSRNDCTTEERTDNSQS